MSQPHTDQLLLPSSLPSEFALTPDSHLAFDPGKREQWRATVQHHTELLMALPGVRSMAEAALPVAPGSTLVFEKENGHVRPLPFDFVSHGLPEPPDDVQPIAVMMPAEPPKAGAGSIALVTTDRWGRQGELSVLYLEQPDISPSAEAVEPRWLTPGVAYKSGGAYKAQMVTENDQTMAVRFVQEGDAGDPGTETMKVFRADVTPSEAKLMATEKVDSRLRYSKRFRRWLGGVTLAAGLLGATYHAEDKPPEITADYADYVGDGEAVARVDQNLSLVFAGKQDVLAQMAKRAGYDRLVVPFDTLKAVETAKDVKQVERISAEALGNLDIGFKIRYDHHEDGTDTYEAVSDGDLEEIKQTTLGVLDGVNELKMIVSDGEKYDVEIVGNIDGTSVSFDPEGNYSSNGSGRPLINVALQSTSGRARDIFVHEHGHHEHIVDGGIGSNFTGIDSEWLKYGADGSGNGKVGRDIITEYAGTNEREDAAEMMEYLFSSDRLIAADADSYVQQKLRYVLASLESRYPGSSAYILQYAEEGTPDVSIDEKVESAFERVRHDARKVFVVSSLLLIGTQIIHAQARKQKSAQSEALGVR
jgi:hypothetical protein